MATSFMAIAIGIVVLAGGFLAAWTDRTAVPVPVPAHRSARPGRPGRRA